MRVLHTLLCCYPSCCRCTDLLSEGDKILPEHNPCHTATPRYICVINPCDEDNGHATTPLCSLRIWIRYKPRATTHTTPSSNLSTIVVSIGKQGTLNQRLNSPLLRRATPVYNAGSRENTQALSLTVYYAHVMVQANAEPLAQGYQLVFRQARQYKTPLRCSKSPRRVRCTNDHACHSHKIIGTRPRE